MLWLYMVSLYFERVHRMFAYFSYGYLLFLNIFGTRRVFIRLRKCQAGSNNQGYAPQLRGTKTTHGQMWSSTKVLCLKAAGKSQ
jgi:hypothetical protein